MCVSVDEHVWMCGCECGWMCLCVMMMDMITFCLFHSLRCVSSCINLSSTMLILNTEQNYRKSSSSTLITFMTLLVYFDIM